MNSTFQRIGLGVSALALVGGSVGALALSGDDDADVYTRPATNPAAPNSADSSPLALPSITLPGPSQAPTDPAASGSPTAAAPTPSVTPRSSAPAGAPAVERRPANVIKAGVSRPVVPAQSSPTLPPRPAPKPTRANPSVPAPSVTTPPAPVFSTPPAPPTATIVPEPPKPDDTLPPDTVLGPPSDYSYDVDVCAKLNIAKLSAIVGADLVPSAEQFEPGECGVESPLSAEGAPTGLEYQIGVMVQPATSPVILGRAKSGVDVTEQYTKGLLKPGAKANSLGTVYLEVQSEELSYLTWVDGKHAVQVSLVKVPEQHFTALAVPAARDLLDWLATTTPTAAPAPEPTWQVGGQQDAPEPDITSSAVTTPASLLLFAAVGAGGTLTVLRRRRPAQPARH